MSPLIICQSNRETAVWRPAAKTRYRFGEICCRLAAEVGKWTAMSVKREKESQLGFTLGDPLRAVNPRPVIKWGVADLKWKRSTATSVFLNTIVPLAPPSPSLPFSIYDRIRTQRRPSPYELDDYSHYSGHDNGLISMGTSPVRDENNFAFVDRRTPKRTVVSINTKVVHASTFKWMRSCRRRRLFLPF